MTAAWEDIRQGFAGDRVGLRLVADRQSAAEAQAQAWAGLQDQGWSHGQAWADSDEWDATAVASEREASCRAPKTKLSLEVRRRRTLLAVMALMLTALALPLSGTGGHSHTTGSALAGGAHSTVYVVQPGDTLWSIATRVDPSGDPRPLVSRLAAQVGSNQVVPGEQITLP